MSHRLQAAAALGLSTIGLCSCGGASDNGVGKLAPGAIVAAANAAADRASSVHLVGSGTAVVDGTFEFDLAAGRGGRGRMSYNGGFFVLKVGHAVYIMGTAEYYRREAGALGANLLTGRWVKGVPTSPSAGFFRLLMNQRAAVARAIAGTGTLSVVGPEVVDGQHVIRLRNASSGATLDVAATGPPYPVEITQPEPAGAATLKFSHWNAPVALAAPPNPIDPALFPKAAAPAVPPVPL